MRPAERLHRPGAGANPLRAGRELLLTFAFRCNFACTFCYVEDGLGGRFRGVDLDEAARLLADPRVTAGVTRVVLSGGEVTLDKELLRYVALARAVPTVEHVRIQTNASRLGEGGLAAALIAAGGDEFFVSLHGADAATCDAITRVPGSFAAILGGLDALRALNATVVTNTVVCAANVAQLADVVALAHERGARGAELWGYVPRVDDTDARGQLVRVTEAAPHLVRALATAEARGLAVTVKYFPRCLLGPFAHVHSDAQPRLVIDDAFWVDYPQYGCLYEGVCSAAQGDDGCSGLSDAYVRRFGWEEDALAPFDERGAAAPAPMISAYHAWGDDGAAPVGSAVPAVSEVPVDVAALGLGETLAGFRVGAASRHGGAVRLRFASDRDLVEIDLWRRDGDRQGFARTASLVLAHPLLTDDVQARARPLFHALAALLAARDDGMLLRVLDGPEPNPIPSPEPKPIPSPEPKPIPNPEPKPIPNPEPKPIPSPEPKPKPNPEPIPSPIPNPDPGGDATALLAAAERLIARGLLRATEVEPSVALGRPDEPRAIVNPSVPGAGRDRAAITRALLDAIDAPRWMHALAADWLADPARVVFVGAAGPRRKLYLQTRTAAERTAAAALLGCAPGDDVLLAVDALGDDRVALKRYTRITPSATRARFGAGALLRLLEARGLLLGELTLLLATRHAPDGARAHALHVDVAGFPQLALGAAWARACGDDRAARRIEASGRATRVLSEAPDDCHVYLGGAPA